MPRPSRPGRPPWTILGGMTADLTPHRYDELIAEGASPRRVRADVASGELVRIRPGVVVAGEAWRSATPERRIVARARALHAVSAAPPVFSHETAAALHGLPLFRPHPTSVHVIAAPGRPGAASGVVRHRGEPDPDVEERQGIVVTSLARTVSDVVRTMTFERAVTIADGALRSRFASGNARYDTEGAASFREQALEIAVRSAHGRARATRALEFADGRAQLPGESISRIRLHQLGFREIGLQSRVAGPGGRDYFVDFALDEAAAFGEFDGSIKYVDDRMTDGRTSAEVFDREKRREDWIRGRTQRRLARWGWSHVSTPASLGARLAAFGILPPR
jgi:hypothetical protein